MHLSRIISLISFKKSILTEEWKKGNLPQVIKDIYGDIIEQPSTEHNIPKSLGGSNKLKNLSISNVWTNNARQSEHLLEWTTLEDIKAYYLQFKDVNLPQLKGKQYIENGLENLKQIGINIDLKV